MSVTRLPQWSGQLHCMIPIILKMELEVVCKTMCGWMNWHHMYHAVVSLLCAEVMSHIDLNCCIPMSVVKFQSLCCCNLFKGQGFLWVNCRVCTLGEDVLELWWIDISTTAVVTQNRNLWFQEGSAESNIWQLFLVQNVLVKSWAYAYRSFDTCYVWVTFLYFFLSKKMRYTVKK